VKYILENNRNFTDVTENKDHLTTFNINNFNVIEAKGFKIIASRSPRMALPP
jgi:hypothetical protein